MNTLHINARFLLLCCAMLAGAISGFGAQAQTPSRLVEVRNLIEAGKLPEASKEIARQLQRPDSDPGLQLLQCVVQAQQNQTDKAIACLSALVKQHPDMLEAYNNLGVLHASRGQHEEAQRWFIVALQRQPAMWTLHQNLQTLQADMSRKAYARALQTELPLKDVPPKLSLLATTSLPHVPAAQAAKASDSPMLPKAPQAAVSQKPAEPQVSRAAASQAAPTTAGTGPRETDTPLKTKQEVLDDATRQQLQDAVQAWAKAWSSQNMSSYFATYTSDYTPGKSITRAAWEAERTLRIAGREFVRVKVSNVSFENTGVKVIARFNQLYVSGNLQSTHRKRLELVRQEGQWKIARETIISN